ncbi:MAG: helix-turn-helix domain-containing protein [Candidatus Brocadiales bacterium]
MTSTSKNKNNKTKAARLLGLLRGTFRYRLEKYGLKN